MNLIILIYINMNIFEKARFIENYNNITEFIVSKKIKIKINHIREIWLNDNKSYVHSIYGSDFNSRIEFENYIIKHFKNITKIFSTNISITETFYLKNGYLHSIDSSAYIKKEYGNISEYYFINGVEYSKKKFNIYIKKNKINRILNDNNI